MDANVEQLRQLANAPVSPPPIIKKVDHNDQGARKSAATRLVKLAADCDLFHTPDHEGMVSIPINGHRETWFLKSKAFRRWLARQFYEVSRTTPGSHALQDALSVLEGRALFQGSQQEVFVRLAEHDSAIYLDLANEAWEAVEITAHGWRIVADPPVRFRRSRGMLALPHPIHGGALADLRPFANLEHDRDWILVAAWLLAALRPHGPYPILVVHGEQGAGKSTLVRVLRSLVDPNTSPLRGAPRDVRDLMIAATNGWCLAFDNLSHLELWLSDGLCRLATGGGLATRELYTDADEILFDAQRPVIINGISELATRSDLLDRALILQLPAIPDDKRRTEKAFWADFDAARPRLLGALLSVVAGALKNLPQVHLSRLPRMADFALWATAAESAINWPQYSFLHAYTTNREAANDLTLDAAIIFAPLRSLLSICARWEGTAGELLTELERCADDRLVYQKGWPQDPRSLSNDLRHLASNLRATGIYITFIRDRTKRRRRLIVLEEVGIPSSASSAASDTQSEPVAQADAADAPPADAPPLRPASTPRNMEQSDDTDAADATTPSYSDARAEPMEVDLRAD